MPEIMTKYPESAMQHLKDAGAKCGEGMPQKILVDCPKAMFCSFPRGEICIYDLKDVREMTQIMPLEIVAYAKDVPTIYGTTNIFLLAISCLFGIAMGMWLKKT